MTSPCQPLYAVIDLGSNSFHMLITRLVADSVQVVDKVKRKVRLASGLNEQNELDQAAMERGWECLSFFAERLQDIPDANIRIVATATLRIATNADLFIKKAERILNHKVNIITGEQEAKHIYLGVAHTSCSPEKRLVIDIGGASTELILGHGFKVEDVCSLDMGCVTFNRQFFPNDIYTAKAFSAATKSAKKMLKPVLKRYKNQGWQIVLGGSGTIQAVMEILLLRHHNCITLNTLNSITEEVIACKSLDNLNIEGLLEERKPVLASGLAILRAIFTELAIENIQLAGGALREGILYELLPNMRHVNIRQRTLQGLIQRFHIDTNHARRVTEFAVQAFQQLTNVWQDEATALLSMLKSACAIHEIGLLLEYKRNRHHAVYIIRNADLPGFSVTERQLLIALVGNYRDQIDRRLIHNQSLTSAAKANYLLMLLRLSSIFCKRRQDDVLPSFAIAVEHDTVTLTITESWLKRHPLIAAELVSEHKQLTRVAINFNLVLTV